MGSNPLHLIDNPNTGEAFSSDAMSSPTTLARPTLKDKIHTSSTQFLPESQFNIEVNSSDKSKVISDEPTSGAIPSESSSTEPKFIFFPELPLELREKIWEKVETTQRIIFIRFLSRDGLTGSVRSPVPPMLHASSESRRMALKSYKLLLGNIPIYIDLSDDVLCFENFQAYRRFMTATAIKPKPQNLGYSQDTLLTVEDIKSGLKHLAIYITSWWKAEELLFFENLETYSVPAKRVSEETWYFDDAWKIDDARAMLERKWKASKGAKIPQILAIKGDEYYGGKKGSLSYLKLHLSKSADSVWSWNLKSE